MNPFPPEDDLTVWFATNSHCRKAQEIRNNPQGNLYYVDHKEASGYVQLTCQAILVDEMSEKLKRKRDYWDQAFPDWKDLLLIKVIPETLQVLNYKSGLESDPITWRAPSLDLSK